MIPRPPHSLRLPQTTLICRCFLLVHSSIPDPLKVAASPLLSLDDAVRQVDDEPVGVAVNGVPFSNHTVSKIFDSCMGHVDGNGCHRYHYHMIPICLLANLGQNLTAVNRTYWKAADPMAMASGWPSVSDPSPVVGWALDGLPIMGPYDDGGRLQLGTSAGRRATLDACNGKVSEKTGRYAYYLTPNPPYAVGCFRGSLGVGTYEDRAIYDDAICPSSGVKSQYCEESKENGPCIEAIFATLETTNEECALACEGPYFLFQTCPPLSAPHWQTYSLVFGLLYLLLCAIPSLALLIYFRHFRMPKRDRLPPLDFRTLTLLFVTVGAWSSALAFLIDPHYTEERLPPIILGLLYGLRYPCFNCCLTLLLFSTYELVDSNAHMRRSLKFLPKTKKVNDEPHECHSESRLHLHN